MSDRDLMLAGKHVMIVDDEPLLAYDLGDLLTAHGGQVVGPCHSLSEARSEIEREQERIDVAVLDVHVGDELVWPLARELRDKGMKFIFVSAVCGTDDVDPEFRDVACLKKPLNQGELRDTLREVLY